MTATKAPPADAGGELAPAKVNLFLHVRGQTTDGYHSLESLAVFPRVGDLLEAEPAAGLSLSLSGPFAMGLSADRGNLVLAAAETLTDHLSAAGGPRHGAALRLEKTLPVASGIGGGSADAGAALRLLARLWGGVDVAALPAIAATLGADTPVCLHGRPALMAGIGERLTPAPAFPAFWMVLVNPMQPLSTAEVFAGLERRAHPAGRPAPRTFVDFDHMASWLAVQRNDLEAPARALRPSIGRVLSALAWDRRCRLARMSGSGATCFGLYAAGEDALAAADRLRTAEPAWWVAAAPVEDWRP